MRLEVLFLVVPFVSDGFLIETQKEVSELSSLISEVIVDKAESS